MSLTSKLVAAITGEQINALDLATGRLPINITKTVNLASGTASGQADQVFTDRRTLAASASENIDLAGVLVDAFGVTLTFARIKGLLITADEANTNNVNVTSDAVSGVPLFAALGNGVPVHPDGAFQWMAPKDGVLVTAGTGDLLVLTNSGAGSAVTYDITIIGASA